MKNFITDHNKLTAEQAMLLGDEELVETLTDFASDSNSIHDFARLAKDQILGLVKVMNERDKATQASDMDDYFKDDDVIEATSKVMNYLAFNTSKLLTLVDAIDKTSLKGKMALDDNLKHYVGYRQDMDIDKTFGYDPEADDSQNDD